MDMMPVSQQKAQRVTDPRPTQTRQAIFSAVHDLVSEDPGKVLSIREISTRAGVSRSSFYTHFPDLTALASDLLLDTFRTLGTADLRRRCRPGTSPAQSAQQAVRGLIVHLCEHRHFYRASLDWQVTSQAHETLVKAYADSILASSAIIDDAPTTEELNDAAIYIAGGVIGLVTFWLRNDDPAVRLEAEMNTTTQRLLDLMPNWLIGRQ